MNEEKYTIRGNGFEYEYFNATSDNTFDMVVYEPESGEYRLIKCSDNGDLTWFNEEILSWVKLIR